MGIDNLGAWLRQQLDDDERVAQAAANYSAERGYSFPTDDSGTYGVLAYEHEQHAARHNPARVLAEVDAKRRIVELYDVSTSRELKPDAWELMKHAVRALALPFADRPGYRDEWKP